MPERTLQCIILKELFKSQIHALYRAFYACLVSESNTHSFLYGEYGRVHTPTCVPVKT